MLTKLLIIGAISLMSSTGFDDASEDLVMHGSTIDVRTWGLTSDKHKYVFPLGDKTHRETFSDLSEEDLAKFSGATYAASQWNVHGIESVSASGHCTITIATPADLSSSTVWTATGESFEIGGETYYLYSAFYSSAMAETDSSLEIPHDDTWSTIVFASKGGITVDSPDPPCTLIDKVSTLRSVTINNPAILIQSDGSYLAFQTANYKAGYVYKSTDRGLSWTKISEGVGGTYGAPYEHDGILYLIGCDRPSGSVTVRKSTDGGYNWSGHCTILPNTEVGYHGSSSPLVENGSRVYRAMGVREGNWGLFLMSAPIGSDLSDPSVWTTSNVLYYDTSWLTSDISTTWQEAALVRRADGSLCIIMRIDGTKSGEYAALVEVESDTKISFSKVFSMPGAAKRLTIAYDDTSAKYWSLVSPFWSNSKSLYGLSPVQTRNSMVLISSSDLENWKIERTCIYSDNAFNNSYHYIDWRFDGDDLVSVFRMSADEERGLPLNYHDSNALGYFRVKNFRNCSAESTILVDTPVIDGAPAVPDL